MDRTSSDESVLIVNDRKPGANNKCYRPLALFFMCFLGFGSYFCYDNPGALQDKITKDMNLSTSQFAFLYSFYAWPNTVLCFIGGFLIDRIFGIRFGTALYALIVFIGQLVFAAGSLWDSFFVMVLGRLIFGIGGESLAVAQNYYAVLWFKGKALNMVFGLQLSIARVGSAVNFIVMGHLYDYVHKYYKGREALGVTLLVASAFCLLSFLCGAILAYLDAKGRPTPEKEADSSGEGKKVVRLSDALFFPAPFWMVSIICIAYYIAIFPFIGLGKVFFMRKFDYTSSQADIVNSMVYFVSAVASPILGYLVDRTGWNVFWVFVATLGTIGAHSLLAFSYLSPYYAIVLLGLAYSMCASALWPMISLVVPEYQLGSAFGVAQALQNLGLAVSTQLAGLVVDAGGYLLLEMFFLGWLFVALIVTLVMWIHDTRNTGILNMTVAQRDLYEIQKSPSMQQVLITEDVLDAASNELNEPQSEQDVRNRYLSKLGEVNIPPHVHRTLR
uniref:Lysosomal dipeptide transporter MFSD1 n=1 Tax=Lygus hesperus TaxID=30085 RepID=A0A0A9YJY8_LYGHE